MSEFSFPPNNSSKKTQFSSLLLSHLLLFFSFISSHPLYFSYFIFFSPYILKVLSFLSPLFITTFLLLLALFTTFINGNTNCSESSELKPSFLLIAYHNILEKFRSNNAGDEDDHQEEFRKFEELEAYKIVFEASSRLELLEQQGSSSSSMEEEPVDKHPSHESYASDVNESLADQIMQSETLQLIDGEKRVEGSLKENDDDGDLFVDLKGEKVVKPPSVESYKGEETSMKSRSNAIIGDHNGVVEYLSKVRLNSQRLGDENGDGEHSSSESMEKSQLLGSMRKEKEWKRTLACKLFEERHGHTSSANVGGGAEEMDLLWETYETTDSNKSKTKNRNEEDEEEDEEEMEEGRLCCLQALKFSAGKMNLGMRRPNLVKISKALKGFGWLHHVTTKHGSKKVYP